MEYFASRISRCSIRSIAGSKLRKLKWALGDSRDLIMALTITGVVSVVTADHFQIRTMLFAALGCNLGWRIIDAGMYLMARLGERGQMP
jgi:hypothetical protein